MTGPPRNPPLFPPPPLSQPPRAPRPPPHPPQGALGKRPDERVGVAERPGQPGDVFHRAPLAEGASRLSSRLGVGGPREGPERLLARRLAGAGHGRDGEREQDERQRWRGHGG